MKSSWFICTIARGGLHNWELCKDYKLWGIPSNGRNIGIQPPQENDFMIIYHAGHGIQAVCKVTGEWRSPTSKEEAPWAGGIFRYGKVVPFEVEVELPVAATVNFEANKISGTTINLNVLRRGFGPVSERDGKYLRDLVLTNKA
jgi:hypothetical protein